MKPLSFYGNVDFPNGSGSTRFHNISELAELLTDQCDKACSARVLFQELKISPIPKWLEWIRLDGERDDAHSMPTLFKANVLAFTQLLLHHLGIDITNEEEPVLNNDHSSEGILLLNRAIEPRLIRLSGLSLATTLINNLFALGKYTLAVSVANKVLILVYNMIEEIGLTEGNPVSIAFFMTITKLVVRWWIPGEGCYHADVQLAAPPHLPKPDVWRSKKTNKELGVCTHKLLRSRTNARCLLSQIKGTSDHACDI